MRIFVLLLNSYIMKARLNITIEAPLLKEVKNIAAKKNISVSEMVEDYFEIITRPKRKLLTEILDKLPKVNIPENKKLSELYYEEKMKEYKNEQ